MKYPTKFRISLLFTLTTALPFAAGVRAQTAEQPHWKLSWFDEFDTDGAPNPKNWRFETGFVRNQEAQWYQSQNARVENGLLIIEARRETRANPDFTPGHPKWRLNRPNAQFTSASLTTQGLKAFRYGRFEMRARIPTQTGLWPAFWTLGTEGPWPNNGEIDIMEWYRGQLHANAAWGTNKAFTPRWNKQSRRFPKPHDPDWGDRFHVWRMDWNEKEIKIWMDDRLLNTVNLDKTFNEDAQRRNPMRQPHYLLLGLAVGGIHGGDPADVNFPARYEIDYVRVFQPVE